MAAEPTATEARPTEASPGFSLEEIRARRPRALARAISLLERGGEEARSLVHALHGDLSPNRDDTRIVGVTGAPGAGKSTLVDRLARVARERGETVAILAVDPTSPFSGGALLGDRIRMQTLYTDPGVFIRSMATRGRLGGLARATHDAMDLLAAAGFDRLLVETVGVGQDEVDVVASTDTVAVVTVPGMGDDVQALKAGLMEIADLYVLNKADRDGVEAARRDLEQLLSLQDENRAEGAWRPPILETVARRGEGTEEVLDAIDRHRAHLRRTGGLAERRRRHLELRVRSLLEERILTAARDAGWQGLLDEAAARMPGSDPGDPYRLADRIFEAILDRHQEEHDP